MSKRSRETWEKKQTLKERRIVRSKISGIRKYVAQNSKEVTDDFEKANQTMNELNNVFKSDGKRYYFFKSFLNFNTNSISQFDTLVRLSWMHLHLLNCLHVVLKQHGKWEEKSLSK